LEIEASGQAEVSITHALLGASMAIPCGIVTDTDSWRQKIATLRPFLACCLKILRQCNSRSLRRDPIECAPGVRGDISRNTG